MRVGAVILCLALGWPAAARIQRDLLQVRGGTGEPTRWTLADWLLDVNGPALASSLLPLDRNARFVQAVFAAGGGQVRVNDGTTGFGARARQDVRAFDADLYVSILNAHAEYERYSSKREARAFGLGLRVLGTSARTTSLVVRCGWAEERDFHARPVARAARRFAEARAQLYLWSWFGADGGYRRFERGGYRYEAGGFVEAARFRVFAGYRRESTTDREQDGLDGGVKLFF